MFRRLLIASTVLATCLGSSASAQYMYLDANGDGIHTSADQLQSPGPTNVDVWVQTNADRDGTPAGCAADPLTTLDLFSYEFILRTSGGTVSWDSFTNALPGFDFDLGYAQNATEIHVGFGSGAPVAPGLHKVGTLVVTVTSGSPSVEFSTFSTLSGAYLTSFGSHCPGADFDNTLKFGSDWHDADGLASPTAGGAAPILAAIADMLVNEGASASQMISATDADGDAISFSKLLGPSYMTVSTTDAGTGSAAGLITLTPGFSDAVGGTLAAVSVSDGVHNDSESFNITVVNVNRVPTLNPIADMTVNENAIANRTITGVDPDGDAITFSKVSGPLFMVVMNNFLASGNIRLTPTFADAGVYPASVQVSDGVASDVKSLTITVFNVNRAPVANAGGPYTGTATVPVAFNGAGSSDPDGDALTYGWNFGDLTTATGVAPSHAYVAAGTYNISLQVSDGTLSNTANTTATIVDLLSARVYGQGSGDKIKLNSGKPNNILQIEPIGGSFDIAGVDLASIEMISPGTGLVGSIFASGGKTQTGADRDGNGIFEISASFAKEDLRQLFSSLTGTQNVTVSIEGDLLAGGRFHGSIDVQVIAGGGSVLAASISPNPLNPSAVITFATAKPGRLRVSLYDISGRLVRVLHDESSASAGVHYVNVDGRNANGDRLASGVYFFRIESGEGYSTGSLTILK